MFTTLLTLTVLGYALAQMGASYRNLDDEDFTPWRAN